MLLTPTSVDATEGEGVTAYTKLGLKPNFDWKHARSGFYATVHGRPTWRFSIPVKSGITYTKQVVEYNDFTEYTLFGDGHRET